MRTKVKLKGGISLIVLVITIIVMIILAAAIILSLSNSGIIGKANKAKTDSDTANLKEYVNTLRAEWELMTDAEQSAEGSFEAYANKKLEKSGYKVMLSDDGVLMNEAATAAVKAGIKVGDTVTGYTVEERAYTTDGSEQSSTGVADSAKEQTVKANANYTWKYIGIDENGSILISPDIPTGVIDDYQVNLSDEGGYLKGPKMLNVICKELYTVEGKGEARSINIDDVINLLEYSGPKGSYVDTSGNLIETTKPKTIEEAGLSSTLDSNINTPDGKDIKLYRLDWYSIDKATHANRITDDVVKQNLVFQGNTYWLASSCVRGRFSIKDLSFGVRNVQRERVTASITLVKVDYFVRGKGAVRPVVTLNSNVKLTPNADKTEWAIS